jgi:hypothetical protein
MQASRALRMVTTLLIAASMAVGGIAIASPGNNGGGGPGNSGLFKPGKGCGDKNHIHYREDECPGAGEVHAFGGGTGKGHGRGHHHGHGHHH